MRIGSTTTAAVLAVALLVLAGCSPAPPDSGDGPPLRTWDPSVTDPAISPDPISRSYSIAPDGTPRGQLAVLLAGTGAGPLALTYLGQRLSGAGFHVIGLRYPSSVGSYAACPSAGQPDWPECHRAYRAELAFGEGVDGPAGPQDHPLTSVDAANSITNRLMRQLDHLRTLFPSEGWDGFQEATGTECDVVDPTYGGCALDWSDMVLIGHSQGAGHALFLSKHHAVARVGLLAGSADVTAPSGGPQIVAPWIAEGGFATPSSAIVSLVHTGDPAREDHRAVAAALGLSGPETSIDAGQRPYGGVGRLSTSITPACPFSDSQTHNSVATDLCSTPVLWPAWEYMATGT